MVATQDTVDSLDKTNTLLLTGARLIDGTGSGPLENAAVLIENDRIAGVGAEQDLDLPPEGVERLDLGGKTLLPGLIDCHVHIVGSGSSGSGCRLSLRGWRVLQARGMLYGLGISQSALRGDLDRLYVNRLLEMIRGSSIDRAAIFAHDHFYDDSGRIQEDASPFYVPNDYVLTLAREHEELLAAGITDTYYINNDNSHIGKTLGELNFRAITDATIIAIVREGKTISNPTAKDKLLANDTLVITGTHKAVDKGFQLLSE